MTSQFKGVCWRARHNAFETRIAYSGKMHHIGCYKQEQQAAKARDKYAAVDRPYMICVCHTCAQWHSDTWQHLLKKCIPCSLYDKAILREASRSAIVVQGSLCPTQSR